MNLLQQSLQKGSTRKSVSIEMQRQIWNCHIGDQFKQVTCPLCGENTIKSPIKNRCQVECAHIVAEKFARSTEPSPLTMYPCCSSCNNSCRDLCLLDHLFLNGRIKELRRMIRSIHKVYETHNPDLEPEALFMHNVMETLFGWERFPSGGGLINTYEIGNIARALNMQQVNEDIEHLSVKLRKKVRTLELLNSKPVGRKRPKLT